MNSVLAFLRGEASRGKRRMVFDWNKAARLIREQKAKTASAGLHSDWEFTGGAILQHGEPVTKAYTYLASTWAAPELVMDDGDAVECWCYEGDGNTWDEATKWPETALAILRAPESTVPESYMGGDDGPWHTA